MDPKVWGPHLWFTMHTISFNYPKNPTNQDKQNNYNFFYNLIHIIPCSDCRKHYQDFFNKQPILNYLDNRDKLIEWVMDAHNNVNKMTNKPIWTLDQVFNHYKQIFDEKKKPKTNNMYKIIRVIVILLILAYFYKKCNK
jgi:hypothetical protein